MNATASSSTEVGGVRVWIIAVAVIFLEFAYAYDSCLHGSLCSSLAMSFRLWAENLHVAADH